MKYHITIEETVSKEFEVKASTLQEALKIAKDKYNNNIFVLDPGNLCNKRIHAETDDGDEWSDWEEF